MLFLGIIEIVNVIHFTKELIVKYAAILLATILAAGCSNPQSSNPAGDAFYVSTSGSDSNTGTSDSPWKTIQYGVSQMQAGTTLRIMAGTYTERVQLSIDASSSSDGILIRNHGDGSVIIDGTGITVPAEFGGLFEITNSNNITLSGLTVRNVSGGMNSMGILVDASSNITIQACTTWNTSSSGMGIWSCSNVNIDSCDVGRACNGGEQECITVAVTNEFTVSYCTVHDGAGGVYGGEGIDAKDGSCNGVISNNSVYGLDRLGIYVDSWNKATNTISVYDNLVYNCDGDGFSAAAESAGVLSNVQFYNNLAYNNTGNGITVGAWGEPGVTHPIDNITIINNTFVGNGETSWGCGVSVENSEADNIVVRNNIMSDNTTCQFNAEAYGTGFIADHNLIDGATDYYGDDYVEGDPEFTGPGSNNYHIGSASPAIDTGSQTLAPATDMDGQPRPSGSGYDIGCYEYQQ